MTKREREAIIARVEVLFEKSKITEIESYNMEVLADIAYQLTRIVEAFSLLKVEKAHGYLALDLNRNTELPKPAPDALVEGIKEAIHLMKNEFLPCINNDCECRKGFGLCSQCKEAIYSFVVKYEPILAAHKPEVE